VLKREVMGKYGQSFLATSELEGAKVRILLRSFSFDLAVCVRAVNKQLIR
jgi:hypothetical protein